MTGNDMKTILVRFNFRSAIYSNQQSTGVSLEVNLISIPELIADWILLLNIFKILFQKLSTGIWVSVPSVCGMVGYDIQEDLRSFIN